MFSHEDALFLGLRAAFRPRGGAGGERRRGGACRAGVVSPACPPDSSRHAEDVTGEKTPFRLERDGETPRDERDKKRARRKSVLSPGRTGRSPGNGPGRATCRNADAPPVSSPNAVLAKCQLALPCGRRAYSQWVWKRNNKKSPEIRRHEPPWTAGGSWNRGSTARAPVSARRGASHVAGRRLWHTGLAVGKSRKLGHTRQRRRRWPRS